MHLLTSRRNPEKKRRARMKDRKSDFDVLYKEVGGEFVPVGASFLWDMIPLGHWHVHLTGKRDGETGSVFIRCLRSKIDVDNASTAALIKDCSDVLIEALHELSEDEMSIEEIANRVVKTMEAKMEEGKSED